MAMHKSSTHGPWKPWRSMMDCRQIHLPRRGLLDLSSSLTWLNPSKQQAGPPHTLTTCSACMEQSADTRPDMLTFTPNFPMLPAPLRSRGLLPHTSQVLPSCHKLPLEVVREVTILGSWLCSLQATHPHLGKCSPWHPAISVRKGKWHWMLKNTVVGFHLQWNTSWTHKVAPFEMERFLLEKGVQIGWLKNGMWLASATLSSKVDI